jgi:predicted enzyme related to lactoylglutathione lyase
MKTLGVMHMLLVKDMDRAIGFYENTFGFTLLQRSDFWSNMDSGKGKIALCTFGEQANLKETTLIIEVDNHKEATDRVKLYGGSIVSIGAPYPGAPVFNLVFTDTENNQVTASEYQLSQ